MKKIKLRCGFCTVVDDFDYDILIKMRWTRARNGGYVQGYDPLSRKVVKMHRFIMQITDRKIPVDHDDNNVLNNTRANLRVCTQSQNAMNANGHRDSTSRFKGVYWCKRSKRWNAKLSVRGKTMLNRSYFSEREAAIDYNKFAKIYHGEYARLNEIK